MMRLRTISEAVEQSKESQLVDKLVENPKNKIDHWKNLNVNAVFKNKFSQYLRDKVKKFEENYANKKLKNSYGGGFNETGVEKIMVPVEDIVPGQAGIDSEAVKSIIDNGEDDRKANKLPYAVSMMDKNGVKRIVLMDGHHRVASQILKGADSVEINVKTDKFA